MHNDKLDILVLIRESSDPRPPASVTTRGAAISDRGLRRVPNPADLAALEEALHLKDNLGAQVTVLAIGPRRLDDTLRLAFSMGADRGIRFWDHGVEGGDSVADARILARIVKILLPDLVFTGSRMADRGDDPVPALAAAAAGVPPGRRSDAGRLQPDGGRAGSRVRVAPPQQAGRALRGGPGHAQP